MTPALIVIGGSAGAVEALTRILSTFPANYAIPVAVVVHLPPGRSSALTEVLASRTPLRVQEVEDKLPIGPGGVFVAPPGYHTLVERGGWFALSVDELVHFSRPSIDVLFESAADAMRARVVGVLLSGANDDGALGLRRIHALGGVTVAQDPTTAVVPTMPEAAIRLGVASHVLPLPEIGAFLCQLGTPLSARCQS